MSNIILSNSKLRLLSVCCESEMAPPQNNRVVFKNFIGMQFADQMKNNVLKSLKRPDKHLCSLRTYKMLILAGPIEWGECRGWGTFLSHRAAVACRELCRRQRFPLSHGLPIAAVPVTLAA